MFQVSKEVLDGVMSTSSSRMGTLPWHLLLTRLLLLTAERPFERCYAFLGMLVTQKHHAA